MVVQGFPKTEPDIQDSQSAAQAPDKPIADERSQSGKKQQQAVVGPLRSPRHNNQQHSYAGADEHEHKHGDAMKP